MEETTEKGDSTENSEQIDEEGDAQEGDENNNETDVIDSEEDPVEDPDAEPVEEPTEEVVDPTIDPEAPTKEPAEDEEVIDGNPIISVTPNVLVPSEFSVSEKEPNDGEDAVQNPLKDLSSATIVYTNGSVSSDKKIRANKAITFKVEPAVGKQITKVEYTTKKPAIDAAESARAEVKIGSGNVYTIEAEKITEADENGTRVNNVDVTIIVTTQDVKYTLKSKTAEKYSVHTVTNVPDETAGTSKTQIDKEITSEGLTTDADKIPFADREKEVHFALKAEAGAGVLRSVTVQAGESGTPSAPLTSTSKTDGDTDADKYDIYTFTPSTLAGLAENKDQDIIINVTASAVKTVTVTAAAANLKGVKGGKLTALTEEQAKAEYEEGTFVQPGSDGAVTGATENTKIIFTAEADENYSAITEDQITAKFTYTSEGSEEVSIPLSVVPVAEKDGTITSTTKVPAHFMIDLADIPATGTLAISVDADEDAVNGPQVKTISFASISQNSVDIYAGDDTKKENSLTGKSIKTIKATDAKYTFDVNAALGYKIYRVDAVYTKTYTEGQDGTTPDPVPNFVEALGTDTLKPDAEGKPTGATSLEDVEVGFNGTDETGTWSTKVVTINVYSEMDKFENAKIVSFTNGSTGVPEYSYTFAGNGVTRKGNDEYEVSPDAGILTLTVDAVAEPDVKALNGATDILTKASKTDTGWVYTVAASALADSGQTISIKKADLSIKVSDKENVNVEVRPVGGGDELNAVTGDDYNSYAVKADTAYRLIVEADENEDAEIASVSYKVGDTEAQTAARRKDGSYVFDVTVTAEVTVDITMADEYKIVVKESGVTVSPKTENRKEVYAVSHGANVTAQIMDGAGVPQDLYNAEVMDGSSVAATWAGINVDGQTAELHFDASEYNAGKTLAVTLTLADKKTKKTFNIKATPEAAAIKVTGVDKTGAVSLPVDTQKTYALTVSTKDATLEGIAPVVIPENGSTEKADVDAARALVSATFNEGNLVITALPNKEWKEKAAKVILVDTGKVAVNDATADDAIELTVANNKKFNGITVTTTAATVDGKIPTVDVVSTTDKSIKVKLGVPNGDVDLVEGDIYYQVEIEKPATIAFPEDMPAADQQAVTKAVDDAIKAWNENNKYQLKEDLDKKGGLLKIDVMTDDIEKGMKIEGFTIKVTLLQTLKENADFSKAGDFITGGVNGDTKADTKDPYYEVKLTLKKGTTTLTTGKAGDVVIATPQFGTAALTSFSTVKVEFVDTSSGRILSQDASTAQDGSKAKYDNLVATYDELSNTVKVNAQNATGKSTDVFKNLGVKVTAYAEDGAYGAVATQKITVVNGIWSINLEAPEQIYKAGGNVSFNVTTDLNDVVTSHSNDKKYAPKSKKLTYAIVGTGNEQEDTTGLSDNILKNVTINKSNGKVTIKKGYEVAPRESANQFQIMATAVDTGHQEWAEVTITEKGLVMDHIVILDGDGKIVGEAGTTAIDLPASASEDEYMIAVLKGQPNKLTYGDKDIVDSALLTFKSGNAKSVSVDENGALTILKSANKVKLTVIPKDGSNKKGKTFTVNAKQAAAAASLKITRYEDSNLQAPVLVNAGGAMASYSYNGNSTNNYFMLEVVRPVAGEEGEYENFYLANYSLNYKDGSKTTAKQIAKTNVYDNKNNVIGERILIAATAKDTKITLTDNGTAGKPKTTYTLTNNYFVESSKEKLKSVSTKDKLTHNTSVQPVSYTLTVDNKAENKDLTGKYVKFSLDRSNKNTNQYGDGLFKYYNSGWQKLNYLDTPLPIVKGQTVNLKVNTSVGMKAGSYSLIATVGTLENGEFEPKYQDKKVTLKLANQKSAKANLKVTGSYTLSLKSSESVPVKFTSGTGTASFDSKWNQAGNYAKNAIFDGQENKFTTYFRAYYEDDVMMIGLNPDLKLEKAGNDDKDPTLADILDDANKNDRTGYIRVTNGLKYVDVKLTINIKKASDDKTKYTVTASPVATGAAVTNLTIKEGKTFPVIENMYAEADSGFTVAKGTNGGWYLSGNIAEAGKKTVTVYMLPVTAPQSYKNAVTTGTDAQKLEAWKAYGVTTTVTVNAIDAAKTGKISRIGSDKWAVTDVDYDSTAKTWVNTGASVKFATKPSVAAATNITVDSDTEYVTFAFGNGGKWMTDTTVSNVRTIDMPEAYGLTITLDKTKLAAKIAADNAEDSTVARKKRLNWGNTVTVKATFKYGTAELPAADTLTYKISLPKESPAVDEIKAELNAAAFTDKLTSDIETYTEHLKFVGKYASESNEDYIDRVNAEVKKFIEDTVKNVIKGADLTVTVTDETNKNVAEGAEKSIANTWKVTVAPATGTALYDKTIAIQQQSSLSEIETAINNLKLGEDKSVEIVIGKGEGDTKETYTVTASTSASEFANNVRKALTAVDTTVSRNISITAVRGEVTAPTVPSEDGSESGEGSIAFTLTIRDLSKAPGSVEYENELDEIEFTLPALSTFSDIETALTGALSADELTKIVEEAWEAVNSGDKVGTDEALTAEVITKVEAKAKSIDLNNPNFSVTGIALKQGSTTEKNCTVTKPTGSEESEKGEISFILQLADATEGTAEAAPTVTINKIAITASEKFETAAQLVTKLKTEATKPQIAYVALNTVDDITEAVLRDIETAITAISKNPANKPISVAIVTEGDENAKTKIADGFSEQAGGTINNIGITIGTGNDAVTDKIDITVKAKESAPATPAE